MAYTTINKSGDYFNTKLYTGNNSTQSITGVGFAPDLVWTKARNGTNSHLWYDKVRGVHKYIRSDQTAAEGTATNTLTSFDSDGFTVGDGDNGNASGANGVAWNWKANGAGSANTDGGINSTVSVNNTAGFSIVKYGTGTGSATTVGHGMNTTPNFIIVKPLGTIDTGSWIVGGDNIDNTWNNLLELNTTAAKANSASFNDTAPTSSVFSVGNNNTNRSGENYIAYCFAEKTGYSKFGSYTGNGNADGPFVYTGFKPAFVICKKSSSTGDWELYDNKRNGFNGTTTNGGNVRVYPNANDAEGGTGRLSLLSNSFKITNSSGNLNGSGNSFIYMAFAEAPLVGTNNVPCTAR